MSEQLFGKICLLQNSIKFCYGLHRCWSQTSSCKKWCAVLIFLLHVFSSVWPFVCSAAVTRPHLNTSARDLQWADDDISRRRLRSATTHELVVRRTRVVGNQGVYRSMPNFLLLTRLRTIGDRAFGAAAPRVWNSLPTDVITASSVATFKQRLKTFLFTQSFDVWRTVTFVVACPRSLGFRQAKYWRINNNNNNNNNNSALNNQFCFN